MKNFKNYGEFLNESPNGHGFELLTTLQRLVVQRVRS